MRGVRWIFITAFFFALIFLLVKENEGRTAAETKVREMEMKIESLSAEKSNLVEELETQISSLEGRLEETKSRYELFLSEKDKEIDSLREQAKTDTSRYEQGLREKEDELAGVRQRTKSEIENFEGMLAEKNKEIVALGKRLEEAAVRVQDSASQVSELLKKKESLEAASLAQRRQISDLEEHVRKTESKLQQLSAILSSAQAAAVPKD